MRTLLILAVVGGCSKSDAPSEAPTTSKGTHEDRAQKQQKVTDFVVDVTIGDAHEKWTPETFAKVAHYASKNHGGQERDTWSLRELAKTLVGPNARVTKVIGGNTVKEIEAAAWADTARVPIVHSTRRGTLKFRWATSEGVWGDPEANDVMALEIVP